MNLKTTGIIIRREYLNKVKKKSFLIITFISPLLFAALCLLPSLIMLGTKEESKKIAVVDRSGIVMSMLQDSETVTYVDMTAADQSDSLRRRLGALGLDAVLYISELDTLNRTVSSDVYSEKPLGVDMTESINRRINDAVEAYRVNSYDIEDLEDILASVKSDVRMKSYTMDQSGKETISESGVFMIVSMVLGMIIYMFIVLFGGMVMSSVIEEKSSRVVEVLISSVKSTELMFGKIIGIALVALTQFLLWVVLTVAIVGVVGAIAGPGLLGGADSAQVAELAGISADQAAELTAAASDPGQMEVIMSSLRSMPIGQILICFVVFFIFGYMLYASLFAAIGSAVENEGDSQQLQLPVTIPLLLAFFIAIYAFKAPDSALVFWGSIIPFTSPIVMLARLPFGVPAWEIVLSVALLIGTFALCAWASAKVYKVGILMFGKKSTWKDLWKWLKQN